MRKQKKAHSNLVTNGPCLWGRRGRAWFGAKGLVAAETQQEQAICRVNIKQQNVPFISSKAKKW